MSERRIGYCPKCNRAGVCTWDCTAEMPEHPVKSLVCIHCGAETFCPKCDEVPGESSELASARAVVADPFATDHYTANAIVKAGRALLRVVDELTEELRLDRAYREASLRERDELRAKLAEAMTLADKWRGHCEVQSALAEVREERAEAAEARVKELEARLDQWETRSIE